MDITTIRIALYDSIITRGDVPAPGALATTLGASEADVRAAILGQRIGKTILPHANGDIWMAGPFATESTPYRVSAGDRSWYANCAWDALGVASLVGEPVDIHARCTDCDEPMPMRVSPSDASVGSAVVHFLLPARRWYDDMGFT